MTGKEVQKGERGVAWKVVRQGCDDEDPDEHIGRVHKFDDVHDRNRLHSGLGHRYNEVGACSLGSGTTYHLVDERRALELRLGMVMVVEVESQVHVEIEIEIDEAESEAEVDVVGEQSEVGMEFGI